MSATPTQLYLLQNGQQVGPFPADAVRAMLESNSVTPGDLAWYEGLPEWRPLSTLFPGVQGPGATRQAPAIGMSEAEPRDETFGAMIGDAFSYPFRGDGLIILITGAIFFTFIDWLSGMRAVGMFAVAGIWGLRLFATGYLASMLQNVVNGSGQGERVLPKWPEFSDWQSDIIDPATKWIGSIFLCFGPGIALTVFGVGSAAASGIDPFTAPVALAGGLLLLAGAAYFPMGILAVAMFDTLGALNPMLIVRSIFRVPGQYFLVLVLFVLLAIGKALTGKLAGTIPILGAAIDGFDALYSSVLLARILGCFYYANRRTLGWF